MKGENKVYANRQMLQKIGIWSRLKMSTSGVQYNFLQRLGN